MSKKKTKKDKKMNKGNKGKNRYSWGSKLHGGN